METQGGKPEWTGVIRKRKTVSLGVRDPLFAPDRATRRDEGGDPFYGRVGRPGVYVYLALQAAGELATCLGSMREVAFARLRRLMRRPWNPETDGK